MTAVTLDGETFELEDFRGLGHSEILPADGDIPAEPRWPDRIFRRLLNELAGVSVSVVDVTATTKTLALSDANSLQACTNGSAQAITIPPNGDVAFSIGDTIYFERLGAGAVSISGGSGVTLNGSVGGTVNISAQYKGAYIRKTATNTWIAIGN